MESGGGRENGKGKRAALGGRAGGLEGWEGRGGGRAGSDHVPPELPGGSERELYHLRRGGDGEGENLGASWFALVVRPPQISVFQV